MLTPAFLQRCADPIMQIYEILNIWAMQEVVRSIVKNGDEILENGARNLRLMTEWGMPAERIAAGIMRIQQISEEKVWTLMEKALRESVGVDFDLFHKGGLLMDMSPAEYCGGKRFQRLIREWSDMTNGELRDFCRVLPESGNNVFREACDQAFMQTRSGIITKDQAIMKSIDYCGMRGVPYVRYSDHKHLEIESAVRTAVTTGINRAAAVNTLEECADAGISHVVVSSHLGARVSEDPIGNHAGWQGKIYHIDDYPEGLPGQGNILEDKTALKIHGSGPDYPSLREATGYPDNPLGLGGYNCRHNFYPYIPGVSKNHMTQFDLEENKEMYEATQEQRRMERAMRRTRRQMEAYKAAMDACEDGNRKNLIRDEYKKYKKALSEQYDEYKKFSDEKGIATQMERTYTYDQQRVMKKLQM